MTTRGIGVTDAGNATGIAEVDTVERAASDLTTTLTADPGSGGLTLAVNSAGRFPGSGSYKVDADGERMLVTAGQGTTSWTVTRGIDGTTAVAHAIGTVVSYVVATQRVSPVDERRILYKGRAATFKTLGRAGTAGQKIFAIHNASGSPVIVDVEKIAVDVMQTAARVVEQPLIRAWRFTAVPTNGNAVTKVPSDSALASNASVTLWQDSSADNTGSTTTLTITLPGGTIISESWGARALTLVGYEQFDREIFFSGDEEAITLRPGEGVAIFLDYLAATANPITDKWAVSVQWTEYQIS